MRKTIFEYEVENKIYATIDDLRKHNSKTDNPIVKVWFTKSNGLKVVTIEKEFKDLVK